MSMLNNAYKPFTTGLNGASSDNHYDRQHEFEHFHDYDCMGPVLTKHTCVRDTELPVGLPTQHLVVFLLHHLAVKEPTQVVKLVFISLATLALVGTPQVPLGGGL